MCDLILTRANVVTMDPARPSAGLVAIRNGRILAVADEGALDELRNPGTRVIDCGGRTLLPGFVDAHCHVHAFAEGVVSLNLSPGEGIRSIADIRERIRDRAATCPAGMWIRAKSYNEFYLAEQRHPDRHDLDAAAPFHPVKLTHRSGHAHVLNSAALRLTGITAETGDPPGGFIDREIGTGEPSGILYGMGEYLSKRIPPLDDPAVEEGVAKASAALLSFGVTSLQDASSANDAERRKRCESWKASRLFRPRLAVMTGSAAFESSGAAAIASALDPADFRLSGVKIIVGSASGELHPGPEELRGKVAAIHAAGLQAVIHAVEELEIEAACGAIEYALKRRPVPDPRHRIEHCSVCPPALLRRMAETGVFVVTQPGFLYAGGDRYLRTVPEAQRAHLYAIGSMLRCGLRVGFSSDFPISDANPMAGIQAAVTRGTEAGDAVLPEERVPVMDALRMYTLDAAAAGFEETIKGSIVPGKLADLVLLREDPRSVEPHRIRDIRADMTVLGGEIVWEA